MEARRLIPAALLAAALCPVDVLGAATSTTPNFVVTAPTQEFADRVGKAAEFYRHNLALEWLGEPLPGNWSSRCPIHCKVGQIGAGGATTFSFHNGEVFGWRMNIQGTEERILDSVLPHEISHMIFASHFRCPLPRWADEGGATLVEHESERLRQTKLLNQVIRTSRRIPLNRLLTIREYPQDMQDVLTLYAEGYSLADFLVQQKGDGAKGKRQYLRFLGDALEHGWARAFRSHYGFSSIGEVEQKWTGWVMAGSPPLTVPEGEILAQADVPEGGTQKPEDLVIRSQNPGGPGELDPLPRLSRALRRDAANTPLNAPPPRTLAASSSVGRFSDPTAPQTGRSFPAASVEGGLPFPRDAPRSSGELSRAPRGTAAVVGASPHRRQQDWEISPAANPSPVHGERHPSSASSRPAERIGLPTGRMPDDGTRLGPAPPDGGSHGLYSP